MPGARFLEWLDSSESGGCPCPLGPCPALQPFPKAPFQQFGRTNHFLFWAWVLGMKTGVGVWGKGYSVSGHEGPKGRFAHCCFLCPEDSTWHIVGAQ